MTSLASHQLGNHNAFFMCLVRQHRAANHVANGPDAWQIGLTVAIHFNHATLIQLEANTFSVQTIGIRNATD